MAESRKDANFSQGWGVAAFITALAVASFVGAGMIKNTIYHVPRDPTSPNQGREESHGPREEAHGAPTAN